MSLNHELFTTMAEAVMSAQRAIQAGWVFSHDCGDSKYETGNMTAIKYGPGGEKIHEVRAYEGSGIDGIFYEISKVEHPELYPSWTHTTNAMA